MPMGLINLGDPMDFRVDCIIKPNRFSAYERIQQLGGTKPSGSRWRDTEDAVIKAIRAGNTFFTRVGLARANVIIAYHNGRPYLKTDRDTTRVDNLLSLNSCPL